MDPAVLEARLVAGPKAALVIVPEGLSTLLFSSLIDLHNWLLKDNTSGLIV